MGRSRKREWTLDEAVTAVKAAFLAAALAYGRPGTPQTRHSAFRIVEEPHSSFPALRFGEIREWIGRRRGSTGERVEILEKMLRDALGALHLKGEVRKLSAEHEAPYVFLEIFPDRPPAEDLAKAAEWWLREGLAGSATIAGAEGSLILGLPPELGRGLAESIATVVREARQAIIELLDAEAERVVSSITQRAKGRVDTEMIEAAGRDLRALWMETGAMSNGLGNIGFSLAYLDRRMPKAFALALDLIPNGRVSSDPFERLEARGGILGVPRDVVKSGVATSRRRAATSKAFLAGFPPAERTRIGLEINHLMQLRASFGVLIR